MDGARYYHGLWWPTNIKETAPDHALRHVMGADLAITLARKSIAIQAGGNIGLWPRRMAPHFKAVHTFEPDRESLRFLRRNTADIGNIYVHECALGAAPGLCAIKHKSLGSHRVVEGDTVIVETLDRLFHADEIGLIQLDVEGYEHLALVGAAGILERCRPVVQLEMRGFSEKYGGSDEQTDKFMRSFGYDQCREIGGGDVIYSQANR